MGKIIEIRDLFNDTLNEIAKNENTWLNFLITASWNFKYNFNDQILMYAQNPNATACAEMQEWNKKVKRWVNKGANCIFVFSKDERNKYPFRIVFDVSDTHNYKNTPYKLWNIRKKYEEKIIESLETRFGEIENNSDLIQAIFLTSNNIVLDSIQDYISPILKYKEESELKNLSDDEIIGLIYQTIFSSVSFIVLNRCGINPNEYITKNEFSCINKLKNTNIITSLGTAISDIAEMELREIARTVINLEKEKNTNRTFDNQEKTNYNDDNKNKGRFENDENRIYENRRLQHSKFSDETRGITNREIRNNEVTLSKEEQERRIYNTTNERTISETSNRNTRNSDEDGKTDNRENGETRWNNRRIESERPVILGTNEEQLQVNGRGPSYEGDNIQLSLLTEIEQKEIITEAGNASVFSFTQQMKDNVLQEKNHHIKKDRRNKIEYFDLYPEVSLEDRNNYKITNNLIGEGTKKEKYQKNIDAIKVLKKCEEEKRYATKEEQEILAQYVGWGGISEVFDSNNEEWEKEYKELFSILTEIEYKEAKESTLTSFYTPPIVIDAIYKALNKMGFNKGNILEPSCRSW